MSDEIKFTLEEVDVSALPAPLNKVIAARSGRLLRFRNAVLARAEVNRNNDELDEQGLAQLAASIALLPIDEEHKKTAIIGYYTDARANGALHTDGIIFADRFPHLAEGIVSGAYRLSIEAVAEQAECSVCGGVFRTEDEYCDHLRNRHATGAVRKLRGLKAVGGAITKNPAGTNTTFDPNHIEILASFKMADTNSAQSSQAETLTFLTESEYQLWRKSPGAFQQVVAKKLSYAERKKLDSSDFALIQKKDGKVLRRFPIMDCSHARNALARLPLAKGLTAAERAEVKRKAEAKLNSAECLRQAPSRRANAAKAAQRLLAQFTNVDLIEYNPRAHTSLSSPVLSPFTYHPPDPAFVEEILARPSAPTKPTEAMKPKPIETQVPKPGPGSADEIEALKQELLKRIAALESKVQASSATSQTGIVGIAWDAARTKPATEKIVASW